MSRHSVRQAKPKHIEAFCPTSLFPVDCSPFALHCNLSAVHCKKVREPAEQEKQIKRWPLAIMRARKSASFKPAAIGSASVG